jgi:N-acetylglucosamine kinase-like BadF-type ATPase
VAIYLGIDGGGTKTACVIGDEHRVLGRGAAGASNVIRAGEAATRPALASAIRQACLEADIEASQISRTVIGIAGAGRPQIRDTIFRLLREILGGEIEVVGDMEIALHAAFGNEPGAVVIAGTGSIAFGRNSAGQSARAGGWGFAVSDEGSGGWIGRNALASALRIRDEGGHAPLLEAAQKCWKVESFEELVIEINATPPADFSGFFSTVLSLANGGDEIAQTVLNQAGRELAALAEVVLGRLFPEGEAKVAVAGGVFHNSALVKQAFSDELITLHSAAVVIPSIANPVDGALAMARTAHAHEL